MHPLRAQRTTLAHALTPAALLAKLAERLTTRRARDAASLAGAVALFADAAAATEVVKSDTEASLLADVAHLWVQWEGRAAGVAASVARAESRAEATAALADDCTECAATMFDAADAAIEAQALVDAAVMYAAAWRAICDAAVARVLAEARAKRAAAYANDQLDPSALALALWMGTAPAVKAAERAAARAERAESGPPSPTTASSARPACLPAWRRRSRRLPRATPGRRAAPPRAPPPSGLPSTGCATARWTCSLP